MPPRASHLQNTLNLNDDTNSSEQEVTCPLTNTDGSSCRKRCMGGKRYRSMQEHIRRAHPEYYIAKLPATKESFELMITSPPHERPPAENNASMLASNHMQGHSVHVSHSDLSGRSPVFNLGTGLGSSYEAYQPLGHHDGGYYTAGEAEAAAIYNNMQVQQQRSSEEFRRGSMIPAASAAVALAQLHHNHRLDPDWAGGDVSQVIFPSFQTSPTVTEADFLQSFYADQHNDLKPSHFGVESGLDEPSFMQDHANFVATSAADQAGLMNSALVTPSSPERPAALPPMQRGFSRSQHSRPRKNSLTQQARLAKHERRRSRELAKRISGDRKLFPSEPSSAQLLGKRWEDLIDAATSATEEEDSRDLTPIPASPYQSPQVPSRTSMPPFAMGSQFQSYQASPLNRALTPPSGDNAGLELQPYSSVDSSLSSGLSHQHNSSADSTGSQFQIMNANAIDNNSSPMFARSPHVEIYCAGCRRLTVLKDAYACTNCISGLCGICVEAIINGQSRGRMSMCPRCSGLDSTFKPFQLDLR